MEEGHGDATARGADRPKSGKPDAETRDGAAVRIPPPLIPLAAVGVGFLLAAGLGPLPAPAVGGARWILGGAISLAGVALLVAAMGPFRETGQDPKPWVASPELIARGVYRWTRNPMYLGMGVIQAGLGVLFANLWIVLLVPISWLLIWWTAIRHEEAYLERKFGDAYRGYRQRVRRWL